ncbi:hypothetical protein BDY24DRAFT_48583 [Mrakia frigida]|uniref:uncharacterized protein n=1 Tax=Mrakia frigida TaxID=29902 RepID=UPI003FCC128D
MFARWTRLAARRLPFLSFVPFLLPASILFLSRSRSSTFFSCSHLVVLVSTNCGRGNRGSLRVERVVVVVVRSSFFLFFCVFVFL